MLKEVSRDESWVCLAVSDSQYRLPSIADLRQAIDEFDIILKDDRRSLVKRGQLFGRDIVAKQPRDKNTRKWAQFLSLFRNAEAKKTLLTLIEFKCQGIASVNPVCVLEKRETGQVVDSWLLYEYRNGQSCDAHSLANVVNQLNQLHALGYQHEDPHFGNFMQDAEGRLFLIDCKGKARSGYFTDCCDFMLLSLRNVGVSMDDIELLQPINKRSAGYWLACAYLGYRSGRTSLKQYLRRRRTIR